MTRQLKVYQGEDRSPEFDYTDAVDWDEVEAGQAAFQGQSSSSRFLIRDPQGETGNAANLPAGLSYKGLPVRNLMEWTEGSNVMFHGRIGTKNYGRGIPVHDRYREADLQAVDINGDLRGLPVIDWVRPQETDVARMQALAAAYLAGNGRATTNLDRTTYVSSSNTVILGSNTYTRTDVATVAGEIALAADKEYFVIPRLTTAQATDGFLFYDGADSTAFRCPYYATDRPEELAANPTHALSIVWDAGPASTEDGLEQLSGIWLYYGEDQYVHVTDPVIETEYGKFEEVVFDDKAKNAAEATRNANAILAGRKYEDRTYSLSLRNWEGLPLDESQYGSIHAGQMIRIKARAIPDADDQYVERRIVDLKWKVIAPDRYIPFIKLNRPLKSGMRGRGNEAQTTKPDLCRDIDSSCIDVFDRDASNDWGSSPIRCLQWRASADGLHSDDGTMAHQAPTGAGEIPTDWLDLDAWTGSTLDFKVRVKGNGGTKSIHIYPWDGGVIIASGPANDPFLSLDFAWKWAFSGGDLYTSVRSENNGMVSTGGGSTLAIAGAEDDWIWLRCQLNDLTIKMKAWLDGTSEPGTWTNTGTSSVSLLDADGLLRADVFALRHILDATGEQYINYLEFTSGIECVGFTCSPCISGGPDATSGTSEAAAPADHDHDSVDNGDLAGGELDGTYPDPTINATHAGSNHLQPVRKNSTGTVFTRRRLNLIEGTNVTLTVTDDAGNDEVDITIAASGGGGSSPIIDNGTGNAKMDTGVQRIYDANELAYLTLSGYTELFSTDAAHMYLGVNAGSDGGGAKIYLQGGVGVVFPNYASDPAGGDSENGQVYYNTTSHKLKVYANGSWVALH